MKNQTFKIALVATFLAAFSSCEVVGGIFKAGVGVGVFIVIFIIAIIIFAVSKMRKK